MTMLVIIATAWALSSFAMSRAREQRSRPRGARRVRP
jgi:hypothetical protein